MSIFWGFNLYFWHVVLHIAFSFFSKFTNVFSIGLNLDKDTWEHSYSWFVCGNSLRSSFLVCLYDTKNIQVILRDVNRVGILCIRNLIPPAWRQNLCPIGILNTNSNYCFQHVACSHISGKMIKWGTVKTCQQSALRCCVLYDAEETALHKKWLQTVVWKHTQY